MANPFIGEIRLVPYTFAPEGWALCNGSLLSIADSPFLYQVIGTTYGGDGQTNFALPDLRGRVPVHQGSGTFGSFPIGALSGQESVTLSEETIPEHSHSYAVSGSTGTVNTPAGNFLGASPGGLGFVYGAGPNVLMSDRLVSLSGGSQSHDNRQPYLALNYIISLFGIFPDEG